MTTKYAIARELIDQLHQYADSNGLDKTDVEEASMILLIQALKNSRGSESMRGLLQYEIDNLGTSVFEILRGCGHSLQSPGVRKRLGTAAGLLLALGINALHYYHLLHQPIQETVNENPAHPRCLL